MIHLRKIFLLVAILFSSHCFAQTLTSSEAKVINRAFNELYKLREVKAFQDTLLGTKDRKIEILQFQVDARSEQVINSNTRIIQLELDKKRLKRQIRAYQIGSIIGGLILIFILK